MNDDEKNKKEDELNSLYEEAMKDGGTVNLNGLIASVQDLPDMPELELYDYDKDIEESKKEGQAVIDSMAGLYLNNNEEVLDHPYIQKKRYHDADNQADMLFLKKMAKRALIMQLRQMDMGDMTPRHFETFYAGLKEIREINKQSTSSQNLMETFYKTLKGDLGLQDKPLTSISEENSESNNIVDQKSLNNRLAEIMKNMKSTDDPQQP